MRMHEALDRWIIFFLVSPSLIDEVDSPRFVFLILWSLDIAPVIDDPLVIVEC